MRRWNYSYSRFQNEIVVVACTTPFILTRRFGETSFMCSKHTEIKLNFAKILLFRICLTLKCNLHSESFRRNLTEVVVRRECILWLLKIARNLYVIYFSIYDLILASFFGACACVHECKLLVIFFDFPCMHIDQAMHDSKVKQSILRWN